MHRERDVDVRLWTARVVLFGALAGHAYQVPLAVGDETAHVAADFRFLHQIQLLWQHKQTRMVTHTYVAVSLNNTYIFVYR